MQRFAKQLCWILLAAFVAGIMMGFCSLAQCQEPSLEAAKARLRELEQQKQHAKELADAKAAEELAEQSIVVEEFQATLPEPIPDEISKPQPSIVFSQPMSAAPAEPYFERYTATYCQPCKKMEAEGFDDAIKAAGFEMRDPIDVTDKPVKDVSNVPQVWLRAADGTPIRRWIGYTTAANVLKPITVDGVCQLEANGVAWSGVAISDTQILTCAHHFEEDNFFAKFPLSFGTSDYVQIKCERVKSDKASDLCLLSYTLPKNITVAAYDVATADSAASSVQGYYEGGNPKRYNVRRDRTEKNRRGKTVDHYQGSGITSRQVGMSGSPMLNAARQVVGIKSEANDTGLIIAIAHPTILEFLQDVTPDDGRHVIAEVTNAAPTPETVAAVLAAHLVESSGIEPQEPVVYGSLFSFDVDVPDTWKVIAQRVLKAQTVEFPSAGLKLDWTGAKRTFSVSETSIEIRPAVRATVNKWFVSYSCGLDGFTFQPDLSSVTVLLSGAPDLTVRLK